MWIARFSTTDNRSFAFEFQDEAAANRFMIWAANLTKYSGGMIVPP